MLKYVVSAISCWGLLTASANAQLADEEGFSGEVNFLTGYFRESNNLSTESGSYQRDIISDPNSENQMHDSSDGDGHFGLLGNLDYTFGEGLNQQVFIGTSREEISSGSLAFEFGYRYKFDDGTVVALSALPTLISTEVWVDPYAVGEERQKTDLSGNVARIKVEHFKGSNVGFDIAVGESEVDNDQAGYDALNGAEDVTSHDGDALTQSEYQLLQRDRKYYSFQINSLYLLPQGYGALKPSFTLLHSDADGGAQSYDSYKVELTYAKVIKRHGFALTLDARVRDYDQMNPLYGKTREDKQYGVFFAYEYSGIFGSKDWSLVSINGANVVDSNIDYYDADLMFFSLGVNYKF